MSYTKNYSITQAGWTLLVTGQTTGFVQLISDGPVLIQVAQSDPGTGSFDGVELHAEGLNEVTMEAMEAGDKIYARCRHNETNTVVALAPGTAP